MGICRQLRLSINSSIVLYTSAAVAIVSPVETSISLVVKIYLEVIFTILPATILFAAINLHASIRHASSTQSSNENAIPLSIFSLWGSFNYTKLFCFK